MTLSRGQNTKMRTSRKILLLQS